MSSEQWQELLNDNNWNNVSLRDARYDQVIHLVSFTVRHDSLLLIYRNNQHMFTVQVSAAQGAEDFYTTANNLTRMEPVEVARKLDKITQQVCFAMVHYHFF